MCRHAPTRHTRTLPHPAITHLQVARPCHVAHAHDISPPSRASEPRTPATPLPRHWASLVAQGGAHGVCPPRLLRSGFRRFQHVPPCTNATHAHPATSRHHAPASRAPLPRRTCARHIPAFTRQRATHACHTAHAHAYPRPSRASKPRTPAKPPPARASEPRMPAASNAAKASFVAQGGTQGLRPPRLLRSGERRFQHVPPCTNATHAHYHTPAIHAPASTRTPAAPRMHTASNAAKASFVAQGEAYGVCPPRLLRSGFRRFQHVPPCTNATHAHTATPPPSTRQQAPHACHTAHAHTPPPSRASEPRTPAAPHMRAPCHTPAIHAPASLRTPPHPAASNAARASWWRRWSWR